MDSNFKLTPTSYVLTNKSEFFGIACLAVIGAASIVKNIANNAYKLGREEKEREIKRGFKKYMKQCKKYAKKQKKIES